MDLSTLPNSAPDTPTSDALETRRVALQSPSDLTHLRALALRNARQKIDLHLPFSSALRDESTGLTKDELRSRVEADVAAYIDRTFDLVRHGVEINGMVPGPGWEGEEEVEGYDRALAGRVQALYARVEELNLEVAGMRREGGKRARDEFEQGWGALGQEDERAREGLEREVEQVDDGEKVVQEGVPWGERGEGIKASWEGAVRIMDGLVERQGAAVGKGKKAVGVLEWLDERGE